MTATSFYSSPLAAESNNVFIHYLTTDAQFVPKKSPLEILITSYRNANWPTNAQRINMTHLKQVDSQQNKR